MQRLEVSGAVRPLYGSLGVKGLIVKHESRLDVRKTQCSGFSIFFITINFDKTATTFGDRY